MAKQETISLVDDLVGGQADETIEFGIDGVLYSVDLTTANAKTLREGLLPYTSVGERLGKWAQRPKAQVNVTLPVREQSGRRTESRRASNSVQGRRRNAAIREWAKKRGLKINERGRVPVHVQEAYAQENG